jgi:hypothetical protein
MRFDIFAAGCENVDCGIWVSVVTIRSSERLVITYKNTRRHNPVTHSRQILTLPKEMIRSIVHLLVMYTFM